MDELADQAYDARSIVGPELSEVEQKLAEASSFEERVRFANDFLLRRLTVRPDAVIAPTANRILLRRGALRVGNAAAEAGIGVRQFERRFASRSASRPNSTRESSGSARRSKPSCMSRSACGPTSRTRSDITTKCT